MPRSASRLAVLLIAMGTLVIVAPPVASAQAGPSTRQLISGGTTTIRATPQGADGLQQPELGPARAETSQPTPVHRRASKERDAGSPDDLRAPRVAPSAITGANPELTRSFNGLNHRDQRLANGGNQFSLEPPDQGLCAGNGFVLETINDVLRVYTTAGTPAGGVTDLNTFYNYPAAFVRPGGPFGPFITDPSCYYDADTQRWFHVVLTLDVVPATGAFTGVNHLDLAVSDTASPLGTWKIYKIAVQNDSTQGTPNHHCSPGPAQTPPPSNPTACIGDYPHIGADTYGFYLTTNEYSFFGPEFTSAQIYAISKKALATGAALVFTHFDNTRLAGTNTPGFTVWPATAPVGQYATTNGGTEFFLSSLAAEETGNPTGFDHRIGLWALTNTRSLGTAVPALVFSSRALDAEVYGVPPKSNQQAGPFPLGQCINDTTAPTPFGPGCWQFLFVTEPAHTEVEGPLDSNDTRMQQVVYANGLVWGALDTIVHVSGKDKAGIAWFAVRPAVTRNGRVSEDATIAAQGYIAAAKNNVIYPAIAVLPSGKGVIAFTLVGNDYYPSAAYATLQATIRRRGEEDQANGNTGDEGGNRNNDDTEGGVRVRVGGIHVAAAGLGPQDGFSEYKAFSAPAPPRPRWGDYGAAVVVGSDIWIASEYIGQRCTLAQYLTPPIGSCDGTRTALANWDTRISEVTP